jgi:hypothetical protein
MKNPFDSIAQTTPQKKKLKKRHPKKIKRKVPNLERLLEIKESQWHDDEYDAGKDW